MNLSDALPKLISLLFERCRPNAVARVVVGRGTAATVNHLDAGAPLPHLPPWLLVELGHPVVDDIRLAPVTSDSSGTTPWDLGGLFVEIPFDDSLEHQAGELRVPDATFDAAWQRLAGFAVPPPIVIDAGRSLAAIWPLQAPIPLDTPAGWAQAHCLQRQLAEALGGRMVEIEEAAPGGAGRALPAWSPLRPAIFLPGSRRHDVGAAAPMIVLAHFEERHVELEALAAALERPVQNTKPAARRARKELAHVR